MRIISLNVNGIRSAYRKGLDAWLIAQHADVVCLQELRAEFSDLSPTMRHIGELRGFFHPAEKKGYSGVAIYTRLSPTQVITGLGVPEFDREGRYLQIDIDNYSFISLYLPSGSHSAQRQQVKFAFMAMLQPHLKRLQQQQRDIVICGDWNIAHQPIDLKNWRNNVNNSGFLPEERAWLSAVLDNDQWIDVWRHLYPQEPGYTWWSNRGRAYANNVGWRIDYQIVSSTMRKRALSANIDKTQKFSDHAPLIVEYLDA